MEHMMMMCPPSSSVACVLPADAVVALSMDVPFLLDSLEVDASVRPSNALMAALVAYDTRPLRTLAEAACAQSKLLELDAHADAASPFAQRLRADSESPVAERADNGTTEVYFVSDAETGKRSAVFKPARDAKSQREAVNERAAFVLDTSAPCAAGVPTVSLGTMDLGGDLGEHRGARMQFVEGEDATDFGANAFSAEDVHRIGVLDVRLLNRDRHAGNLMRARDGSLVPIDHALGFPRAGEGELADVSSELWNYPQAKQPFSEDMLASIAALSAEADVELLHQEGVEEDAQLSVWMATTLLKKAAGRGRTLHDIGAMVSRQGDRSEPSLLESLFHRAVAAEALDFFEVFEGLVDEALDL